MALFSCLSVLLLRTWDWGYGFRWSTLVSSVTAFVEYAFIGSAMYLVAARNRCFTLLFRQPLRIDIFDPAPVRPMGRWGLSVAAAIMGGVTISVLLVGDARDLVGIEHLPMYLVATATSILSFFGSLSSAHRALVAAKEGELRAIRGKLAAMYAELKRRPEGGGARDPEPGAFSERGGGAEMANAITAWLGYERRIANAEEWPYTANTLRGLFASVLLPIMVTIIQQVIARL
jgi:hypothetical protein